jgi:hypothetical protein
MPTSNKKANLALVAATEANSRTESDMPYNTDDLRIREIKELTPPADLMREYPCTEKASTTVYRARDEIHRIMHRGDSRLRCGDGICKTLASAAFGTGTGSDDCDARVF